MQDVIFDDLLKEHMSERGYKFWLVLKEKIDPVWDRLASSSMKYHKKKDGRNPTIEEHTHEMLFAATKLLSMFNFKKKSQESDILLLSIVLHDARKYGKEPCVNNHTVKNHGKLMADSISMNRNHFLKIFDSENISTLEEAVRFHDGKWAVDANSKFDIESVKSTTFFVHILDMLSSRDLIKV